MLSRIYAIMNGEIYSLRGYDMKTFKLIDLAIEEQVDGIETHKEIPIEQGLVINQKDGENHWMLECVIPSEQCSAFETYLEKNEEFNIWVTITKRTNHPAHLIVTVKNIIRLEKGVSLLLDGRMVSNRFKQSEGILEELIEEGYFGEKLLEKFRERLYS
jgi:hypothetical protein